MAIQFRPLSINGYSIPKAQILFKPNGADHYTLLGDADSVTLEPKPDVLKRYSNETGVKTLADTITVLIEADLSLTLVQMSDFNRALAMLGTLDYDTQSADTGHTMTLTAPIHDGSIYPLINTGGTEEDHDIDVDTIIVTDDTSPTPVTYTLGTDYKVDAAAGFIQLLNKHAGASGNVVVTWDTDAVLTGVRSKFGVGQVGQNTGQVVIRGTNDVGPRVMLKLWQVQMRPAGPMDYVSDKNLNQAKLLGSVINDGSQAVGFQLGYERALA